jgi:hypothetical protein
MVQAAVRRFLAFKRYAVARDRARRLRELGVYGALWLAALREQMRVTIWERDARQRTTLNSVSAPNMWVALYTCNSVNRIGTGDRWMGKPETWSRFGVAFWKALVHIEHCISFRLHGISAHVQGPRARGEATRLCCGCAAAVLLLERMLQCLTRDYVLAM